MDVLDLVQIAVPGHAKLVVQLAVQLVVVPLATIVVKVVVLVVVVIVMVCVQVLAIYNNKECDKNQRKPILLAVRYGEEHHLHRHQGLPVGLQILLPRGQKCEGTDALGGGQDLYRLCA